MVSIIIVNYNTFQITCDCIASVMKHTVAVPYEVIVVDNASPEGNPERFLAQFPNIVLVKSAENGGFARGNNLGIAHAKGDIILLLNSDTYLTEDSISKAAHALNSDTKVGALTVRLTYPDGKLQHTARKFRNNGRELLDLMRPALKLMPYKQRARLMLNQYFHGDFNTYCDWVSGAFMMFRRSLLSHLPEGKLDERYFMYGEDQLWCYQFQQAGFRNYYLCETTVIHIHQASTKPEKQLQLLKRMLQLELDLYALRTNNRMSRFAFAAILGLKEQIRYQIKQFLLRFFGYRLR